MTWDCGGCQGMGAHRRHCPKNPTYSIWLPLADMAEDIGDRIGGNDPGLANHAYSLAGQLKAKHRESFAVTHDVQAHLVAGGDTGAPARGCPACEPADG